MPGRRGNDAAGTDRREHHGGSHEAETLDAALKGIRELSQKGIASLAGVALFADYAMNPADWETYRRDWRHG